MQIARAEKPPHSRVNAAHTNPITTGTANHSAPEDGDGSSIAAPHATQIDAIRQPITVAVETIGGHKVNPLNIAATPAPSRTTAILHARPKLRADRSDARTATRRSPVRCSLWPAAERRVLA